MRNVFKRKKAVPRVSDGELERLKSARETAKQAAILRAESDGDLLELHAIVLKRLANGT